MALQIVHGERAFAQFTPDEQAVILRAARSKWLSEIAKRVDNTCPLKRAKVSAGQKLRWKTWRANREAERQAEIAKHGYPADWQFPPKPKPKRVYTRMELLDILEAEMRKVFPEGCTPQNQQAWLSYKPKDPRLEGHV